MILFYWNDMCYKGYMKVVTLVTWDRWFVQTVDGNVFTLCNNIKGQHLYHIQTTLFNTSTHLNRSRRAKPFKIRDQLSNDCCSKLKIGPVDFCLACSQWYIQDIDGLVGDCSNSITNALVLLQSCTKASKIRVLLTHWHEAPMYQQI